VPPEQEEAESQENMFFQAPKPPGEQDEANPAQGAELSDEQLVELVKNVHALSPEQQQQLHLILQQRMENGDRAQSYENVRRAKDRLAPLGVMGATADSEETDRRILRQKQEFETLYRQYQNEAKAKELKRDKELVKDEKRHARESRI